MARPSKRAKEDTGGPARMGDLRSAASVRDIRFKDLSVFVIKQGPGTPEEARKDVMQVNLDTKHCSIN